VDSADLQRAWVLQAQLDAERGVIECRICKRRAGLDQVITLWRNGTLVFAICDRCAGGNDILLTPTEAGIEVRGRKREPIVVGEASR
jgi:hypothetical protein